MNPEFLQKLLSEDPKAKVVCQVSKTLSLDYVSLQTSMMCEVFSKFPEVLLVIRCHNDERRALYTFLADGPRVGAPYELTRMVHVAVPACETPKGLAHMFHIIKELNPNWPSIEVFLVDPDFPDVNAIHEAFPSAEVVLSAFHVYTSIQQRIRLRFFRNKAENGLLSALKNTMCSATDRNLKAMYKILQHFLDPTSNFADIKFDWLVTERIWALHRWRSWNDCLQYFDMVEGLSHRLNAVFRISPCLTRTMNNFVMFMGQAVGKSKPQARDCSPEELAILKCKTEISEGPFEEPTMEAEVAASMSESLNSICNSAAFILCENELDVTQKSVKLVGTSEGQVCVQIFEKPNEISGDKFKTCTCSFHQCTKLPCRHILTVLNASQEILQSEMLHTAWQRQTDEPSSMLPVTPETLEILEAQGTNVSEKHVLVNTLTGQISALLAECSDELFQQRYNALRQVADTWIGPYEEVTL